MLKPQDRIFKYYFYFIEERMNIFWSKYNSENTKTSDNILKTYKFTNVYRATDRVSQYLIKNVIYSDVEKFTNRDILLRILIFKIFNKIETWEYLEKNIGVIKETNFDLQKINKLLNDRRQNFPIFSNAYMMTGTHSKYNYLNYKHEKWLQMVKNEMLDENIFDNVISAKSMSEVYSVLRNCSFIGDFLAYQYTIDFNYSPVINFDEDSFVKAGIGAIRGIKKCFGDIGKYSYEDAIRFTQDNFEHYQNKYGQTSFQNLYGRPMKLIDIQNCFCETDKYLRAKMPELQVDNVRIKQKYKEKTGAIELYFPAKWGINYKLNK